MNTVTDNVSHTFKVAEVEVSKHSLRKLDYKEAIELTVKRSVESCSARLTTKLAATGYHPFLAAAEQAFNYHLPLILSPDHVWLLICQGVANHINVNAEKLRKQFVSFEGKEKLVVRRDDFIKGAMENPWEEVWPEFVQKIGSYTGPKVASMFDPTFSTTGNIEKASCQVVLMDAMQSYFEYTVNTYCGIPHVTLEGTVDDWDKIVSKIKQFAQYGLQKWTALLDPILQEFRDARDGNEDTEWWKSFYKDHGGSGGPFINGHILSLFPYLSSYGRGGRYLEQNPRVFEDKQYVYVSNDYFPAGLSKAPFVWEYYGNSFNYEFLAGFVGINQKEDLSLRPEIGWAVSEVEKA